MRYVNTVENRVKDIFMKGIGRKFISEKGIHKHCKKWLAVFPSPAGISLTNSPWQGIIKLFPEGRVW
jgi:hypothetical protein